MDLFEPRLGASKEQLQALHEFATQYLAEKNVREQREAQKLEEMRAQIKETGEQFKKLWINMGSRETISTPLEGGNFLVVRKSGDRLRMANTTNDKKELGGYLPPFEDISDWQEVTVESYGRKEPQVRNIYHWDRKQLDQYEKGSSIYWGLSTEVSVDTIDKAPADLVVQSFENTTRIMKVPDSLLTPQ